MPVKADGCPNTIFTDTQRDQLAKLLYNASPQETRDETLQRLERLTTTFNNDLRRLGFRPLVEIGDRASSSRVYHGLFETQMDGLSPMEIEVQTKGIFAAENMLRKLAADVERCWRGATGAPLPRLKRELLKRYGVGFQRELTFHAASHPLWLIVDAAGVKVGAATVNQLVCEARKNEGEEISVPAIVWPFLYLPKPKELH
jgi:hypothetical protein